MFCVEFIHDHPNASDCFWRNRGGLTGSVDRPNRPRRSSRLNALFGRVEQLRLMKSC